MLGRLTQWVSAKLDVKEDDHLKQRFDALTRLKKATLDVMQAADGRSTSSGELDVMSPSPPSGASTPKKPRRVLTDDDLCVHEFGNALETCLKLGLRHQSDHTVSLWNVLYTSSLVLDEPSLVNAIQQAATLSQTDAGKALCWMKLALNKQTMETSLMIIFSMACDQVVRTSYEDWALVRCSEGLDLFLQMVIDCRALRFNLKVDDEPFRALPPREVPTIPIAPQASEATKVDGDATAVPTAVGDSSPLPASLPTSPLASDVSVSADKLTPQAETPAAVPDDEFVEISAVVFPHRHKGIKPWQHVFGVSIAYLSKNPYHSRFALIDPVLSIPNIVQDCIDILYEFPDTPRLFRTTVLSVTVSQLREVVESEGALPGDLDAHGAGALLLDFFKNLPESLLTSEKYEAFVASGRLKDEEASVRNIALLVQELPVHCKYVLEKVIGVLHFLQLPEHAQHNGIDLTLASFMLAPVVAFKSEALTTAAGGRRKMSHPQNHDVRFAAVGAQVVERMIKHHDVIFQDVRVQVSDALERLESKKQALLSMYQLYKMKPQVNFLSDRQYLDEISDIFVESVKKKESPHCDSPPSNNNHTLDRIPSPVVRKTMASPLKHRASSPSLYEGVLPLSTSAPPSYSAVMAGATSNARTSSGSSLGSRRQPAAIPELNNIPDDGDRRIVDAWQKHGFNRPTILGNFDKGGVLLLRCVAHMVKNDRNLLERLYTQALPTVQSSFDAGLVASAICKSLVRLLHLVPAPEHPTINIVALSVEPFWELFAEEAYFLKLFLVMFQIFDALWHALRPDEASFTRVFCDTESKMDELLKNAPSCVDDLRGEWLEMWRLMQDDEDASTEEESGGTSSTTHAPIAAPPSPPRVNRRPSFTFKPDDYKHKLLGHSHILTPEHVAFIDHSLPITTQLCRWCLLYSSESHGSSLHTLIILAKNQSPTLIVVKDDLGNVFGGYGSDEWHKSTQYFGNGETFLFSFSPRAGGASKESAPAPSSVGVHYAKYPWSRRNNYFMLCSDESLVMGGGGSFGLYLDADLSRGTTGPCETFSSRPLVPSQEFNCVHVEVWGFTHSDKHPSTHQEMKKRSVLD